MDSQIGVGVIIPSELNRDLDELGLVPSGPQRYTTWGQVGGYFDGDGNVSLEIVKRVLQLRIRFVDTWEPQVAAIKYFLNQEGIKTGKVGCDNKLERRPAFRLEVAGHASVLRVAKAMIPYCIKKAEDLRITIDYLEERITGNQALAAFNEEVRIGRRRGSLREANIPYTRQEGLGISKLESAQKARASHVIEVPPRLQEMIRKDHSHGGLGTYRLSKKYGYSRSVIRRVLHKLPAA